MSKETKPKSKSGLLAVLISMCLMIGFALGFSINLFVDMNTLQTDLMNIDQQIMFQLNNFMVTMQQMVGM